MDSIFSKKILLPQDTGEVFLFERRIAEELVRILISLDDALGTMLPKALVIVDWARKRLAVAQESSIPEPQGR